MSDLTCGINRSHRGGLMPGCGSRINDAATVGQVPQLRTKAVEGTPQIDVNDLVKRGVVHILHFGEGAKSAGDVGGTVESFEFGDCGVDPFVHFLRLGDVDGLD